MKRKIIVTGGLVIFLSVMSANIQFAISGYGIGTNSLHAEVLAQSSSTGGGSSSGGGTSSGPTKKSLYTCGQKIVVVWIDANASVGAGVTLGAVISGELAADLGGKIRWELKDSYKRDCIDSGNDFCIFQDWIVCLTSGCPGSCPGSGTGGN